MDCEWRASTIYNSLEDQEAVEWQSAAPSGIFNEVTLMQNTATNLSKAITVTIVSIIYSHTGVTLCSMDIKVLDGMGRHEDPPQDTTFCD